MTETFFFPNFLSRLAVFSCIATHTLQVHVIMMKARFVLVAFRILKILRLQDIALADYFVLFFSPACFASFVFISPVSVGERKWAGSHVESAISWRWRGAHSLSDLALKCYVPNIS